MFWRVKFLLEFPTKARLINAPPRRTPCVIIKCILAASAIINSSQTARFLTICTTVMLALIPSTAFSLVAGGLAGVQQMRSPVSNVNMALDRPIRVAVIGGGPSGACAAEIFAKVSHGLILRAL